MADFAFPFPLAAAALGLLATKLSSSSSSYNPHSLPFVSVYCKSLQSGHTTQRAQTDGVVHVDVACGIRVAAVRVPLLEGLFLLAGSSGFLDGRLGCRRFGLGGGFGGWFRFGRSLACDNKSELSQRWAV